MIKYRRTTFVLVLLSGVAVVGVFGEYMRVRALNHDIEEKQKTIALYEEQNTELEKEEMRLGSAAEAEREARLKLNMRSPGEEVVVIRRLPKPISKNGEQDARNTEHIVLESNVIRWWRYFFN